jgi:Zn-dependent membrane protease YugP
MNLLTRFTLIFVLFGLSAPLIHLTSFDNSLIGTKLVTFFQLVTLPVEFDASRRAKQELISLGILQQDEMVGVNKTLNAAALTYVAAFVSSLAWLIYYVLLSRR